MYKDDIFEYKNLDNKRYRNYLPKISKQTLFTEDKDQSHEKVYHESQNCDILIEPQYDVISEQLFRSTDPGNQGQDISSSDRGSIFQSQHIRILSPNLSNLSRLKDKKFHHFVFNGSILLVPYIFKVNGCFIASLLVMTAALISWASQSIIAKILNRKKLVNYSQLIEQIRFAPTVLSFTIILQQYLTCLCAQLILKAVIEILVTNYGISPDRNYIDLKTQIVGSLINFFVILPMCFLDLEQKGLGRFVMMLSIGTLITITVTFAASLIIHGSQSEIVQDSNFDLLTAIQSVMLMLFCFLGQPSHIPIYSQQPENSLQYPHSKTHQKVQKQVLINTVLFLAFGILGYIVIDQANWIQIGLQTNVFRYFEILCLSTIMLMMIFAYVHSFAPIKEQVFQLKSTVQSTSVMDIEFQPTRSHLYLVTLVLSSQTSILAFVLPSFKSILVLQTVLGSICSVIVYLVLPFFIMKKPLIGASIAIISLVCTPVLIYKTIIQ